MIGAPAQAGTDGANTVVQLILAMAGSGVLVATVQGLFTRGRTRAEVDSTGATATKTITDAASVILTAVQADNAALRADMIELRKQLAHDRAWREAAERNFELHEEWDALIAEAVRNCTESHAWSYLRIDNPPPLRPTL